MHLDQRFIEVGEADNIFDIKALSNNALDRMVQVEMVFSFEPLASGTGLEHVDACGGKYCRPRGSTTINNVKPGLIYTTDQTSGDPYIEWNCNPGEQFVFMIYDSMGGLKPSDGERGSIISLEWGINCTKWMSASMSAGGQFPNGVAAGAQPGHPYYGYNPPGNPTALPNTYHFLVFVSNKTDFDLDDSNLEGGRDRLSTNITKYLGDNGLDTLVARAYARTIGGYYSASLMQSMAVRTRYGDAEAAAYASTACETIGLTFPGFDVVDADAADGATGECTPTDCNSARHVYCATECTRCAQVPSCAMSGEDCPQDSCRHCFNGFGDGNDNAFNYGGGDDVFPFEYDDMGLELSMCKSYLACPEQQHNWGDSAGDSASGSSGSAFGSGSGSGSGSNWVAYYDEYVGDAVDHNGVLADIFFDADAAKPATCAEKRAFCKVYEFIDYACPVTCGANQFVASNYTIDQNEILYNQYNVACATVAAAAACNEQPALMLVCPETCAKLAGQEAADLESQSSGSGESGDDDDALEHEVPTGDDDDGHDDDYTMTNDGSGGTDDDSSGRQRRGSSAGTLGTVSTVTTKSTFFLQQSQLEQSKSRNKRGDSTYRRVRACKDNDRAVTVLWGMAGAGQPISCASTRKLFGCLDPGFAALCPETCMQCIDGIPEAMHKKVRVERRDSTDWLAISERSRLVLRQEKLEALQTCNAKVAASDYECSTASQYCPSP